MQIDLQRNKYVAIADTLAGEEIIGQSEEFKSNEIALVGNSKRAVLVAQLLQDGWEPLFATNIPNSAVVTVFRRQVVV